MIKNLNLKINLRMLAYTEISLRFWMKFENLRDKKRASVPMKLFFVFIT